MMDSFIDVIDLQTMTSMSPLEQIPTQGAWDPAYGENMQLQRVA
jgi:hypothetical protein